ncbi:MAG: GAF domain-containing protein [Calditrichaeota bacterium]|nr:MAG: GAF domain-containing protein [Calditrichota bacterium]
MILNRYKILEEIGSGGMGSVFKVADSLNKDKYFALKTLSEGSFGASRFKREFSRISKLRHKNIVQVFDFGSTSENGLETYFFLMELLEGKTLKEIQFQNLQQVYKVIFEVCLALDYVHSRQLIHCDLKPANIFVLNPDSDKFQIKLMDFGLAEDFNFDNKGKISGTIAYLPPERAKGLGIDQRADLYSLGVIFYELATGKSPFAGNSVIGILKQQLNFLPEEPQKVNPEIPTKVSEIILKLLAKEPSDRFPNALEVLQELASVVDLSVEFEVRENTKTHLENLVNSNSFQGREKELSEIKTQLFAEKSFVCEVVGETGSGKSRLLSEVKFLAQLQDYKVVFCDASEMTNFPFATLTNLLEGFCKFLSKEEIQIVREKFGKVLGKILPTFVENGSQTENLSPSEEERFLAEATKFLFENFKQNYLLILENSDSVDSQTLNLLRKITLKISNPNFNLLFSSNNSKFEKNGIKLKGLEEKDVQKLINSIFSRIEEAEVLSRKVFDVTEGNPLFVLETIKSLVSSKVIYNKNFLWKVNSAKLKTSRLSKNLAGILTKNLKDLSKIEKEILIWFAVAGKSVKAEDIFTLTKMKSEIFWETLNELVGKGILLENKDLYKISHKELQKLLYDSQTISARREKHSEIALHFERKNYSEAEIFFHANRGRLLDKLLFYSLVLGNRYLKMRFFDSSIRIYETALETLELLEPKIVIETVQNWSEKTQGKNSSIPSNWIENIQQFSESKGVSFVKVLLQKYVAMMQNELGETEKALETYFSLLEVAEEIGEEKQIGGISTDIAGIYVKLNDLAKAETFFEKASEIYEQISFKAGQMLVLNNLGAVYLKRNNYTKVLECYDKALTLAKELKNSYFQAVTLLNKAEVLGEFSTDYQEIFTNYEKSFRLAEKLKRNDILIRVWIAKGKLNLNLGNFDEVEKAISKTDLISQKTSITPEEKLYFTSLKAQKLFFEGKRSEVEEFCKKALRENSVESLEKNQLKFLLGKVVEPSEKNQIFTEVLENSVRLQNRTLEAFAICELAKTNRNVKSVDKVYQFGISLKNREIQIEALLAYSVLYFQERNYKLALENLQFALEENRVLGYKTYEFEIYSLLFEVFGVTNQKEKLSETAEKLLELAKVFNNAQTQNLVNEKMASQKPETAKNNLVTSNLENLLEVISAINSTKNLEELLALIVDKTLETTQAERGFLMLKNEQGELEFETARNFNREDLTEESLEISFSTVNQVFKTGSSVFADNIPKDDILSKQGSILDLDLKVILCVPLKLKNSVFGVIYVDSKFSANLLQESQLKIMEALASQAAIGIENARLYSLLETENRTLKQQIKTRFKFGQMIGKSPKMLEVYEKIEILTQRNVTVMITGATGTGKELVAKAIHYNSKRSKKPLVILNCAALPENLLESELFGYERGAFTGATERRKGKFEQADGGAIFLDEIGDMPLSTQAKILRLIQEKKFYRLGGDKEIEVNVRIIAATHRNLTEAVKKGDFRQDLFYRLNIAEISLPPLSERREDIPLLVKHFLEQFKKEHELPKLEITQEALEQLTNANWEGNIRELENFLEQWSIFAPNGILDVKNVPKKLVRAKGTGVQLDVSNEVDASKLRTYSDVKAIQKDFANSLQKDFFGRLLKKHNFNIAKTAEEAQIARPQLHNIVKDLGIGKD